MGFRTPDRFGGSREEEEILFEEKAPADPDPSAPGGMIYRDGGFVLLDALGTFNPRGGLSEADHELLDTLAHDIVENSFEEIVRVNRQPVNITIYTDATKTTKIRETQLTYTSRQPTEVVTIQYNASGLEVYRLTEVITYVARQVSTIERTRTP